MLKKKKKLKLIKFKEDVKRNMNKIHYTFKIFAKKVMI